MNKKLKNTGNTNTVEIVKNKRVRQRCPLSPALFNIRISDIVQKWKNTIVKGIQLTKTIIKV